MTDETQQPADEPNPSPERSPGGNTAARVVIGVVGFMLLALFGLVGFRMAASSGLFGAGGGPSTFSSGQLVSVRQRPAPDFRLKLFSGEDLRLADLRGKPVLVNFWASWCGPCREEAPLLSRIWKEYKEKGVVFVGVNVWDNDQDARKFIAEFDLTFPNGPDAGGRAAVDYGLTGIPETFFVDRQGRIIRKWIGPFNERTLRAFLDELVAAS